MYSFKSSKCSAKLSSSLALVVTLYLFLYIFVQPSQIDYLNGLKNDSSNNNNTKTQDPYLELHNRIISGHGEKKVVFFEFSKNGYGNSIYSLLSALMIAVLTDSVLLINWQKIEPFIDCSLKDVFVSHENDKSFLDRNNKTPEIHQVNPDTENTFMQNKSIKVWLDG